MSRIILEEQTTPVTPAADKVALYPKAGGEFYRKNDAGSEDQLVTSSDIATLIDTIVCHEGNVITHDGNVIVN